MVDFTDDGMVGVRADGWWGDAPLYSIRHEDIIDVVAAAPLSIAAEPDREIE